MSEKYGVVQAYGHIAGLNIPVCWRFTGGTYTSTFL